MATFLSLNSHNTIDSSVFCDVLPSQTTKLIWQKHIVSKNQWLLLNHLMLEAIRAFLERKYSKFDAHTTSNCCHGMSLFVSAFFSLLSNMNFNPIVSQLEQNIHDLKSQSSYDRNYLSIFELPNLLFDLTSLYTLSFIGDLVPGFGRRSFNNKLKLIEPLLTTKFCDKLIADLQKYFSNRIAHSYSHWATHIDSNKTIHDIPIYLWEKYIQPSYMRMDKRGVLYTSCLFSMQILLAYLIQTKSKIAIVNDLYDKNERLCDRYIELIQGDGNKEFKLAPKKNLSSDNEPIVVFWGSTYSTILSSHHTKISEWLDQFHSLILACDIHYPQFPKVSYDTNFNSTPINPDESILQSIISDHEKIAGTSLDDRSLFHLIHIYPASLSQILELESLGKTDDMFLETICEYD